LNEQIILELSYLLCDYISSRIFIDSTQVVANNWRSLISPISTNRDTIASLSRDHSLGGNFLSGMEVIAGHSPQEIIVNALLRSMLRGFSALQRKGGGRKENYALLRLL
jgi:hypothetical protein